MVMAGNPILPAGAFFDAFSRGRDLWYCICVMRSIRPTWPASRSINCCKWIRVQAVRSIRIQSLTSLPGGGQYVADRRIGIMMQERGERTLRSGNPAPAR
jgi:hypothetical protein